MNRRNFLTGCATVAVAPAFPKMALPDPMSLFGGEMFGCELPVNAITAGELAIGTINASSIIVNNIMVTGHLKNIWWGRR